MLKIFISLFIIWVIFSGYFSLFFLGAGIITCFTVIILLSKYTTTPFYAPSHQLVKYMLWLFYQMIMSALSTTKIIWQKKPNISPKLEKIKHQQANNAKLAILVNSITLTPGTITVYHDRDYLYIHALAEGYLKGVNDIITKLKNI